MTREELLDTNVMDFVDADQGHNLGRLGDVLAGHGLTLAPVKKKRFKKVIRWLMLGGLTEDDQVGRALLVATLIIAVILLALNVMGPGL